VNDYAVRVQETRIFATRLAWEWWTDFLSRHDGTGRLTVVAQTVGGGVVDVACDDEEHARWLAAHMESQGIPRAGLKVVRTERAA
jgi:hypothetical protein